MFVVYLYQCWIYGVDYQRFNGFGQVGTMEELDVKEEQKGEVVVVLVKILSVKYIKYF